jgi:hypothetical protein
MYAAWDTSYRHSTPMTDLLCHPCPEFRSEEGAKICFKGQIRVVQQKEKLGELSIAARWKIAG